MRILIGVDFSRFSDQAVEAIGRRPWPTGSRIRLVCVVAPLDMASNEVFVPRFVRTKTQAARQRIEAMAAALSERGLPVSAAVVAGHPRSALSDYAASWKADLIVVGSRGRGAFRRLLLGSVAAAVVRRSVCSVEIARPKLARGGRDRGMRLLLATDGSRCSLAAARSIAARPWPAGSRLRVVSVAEGVRPLAGRRAISRGAEARLDRASRRAARSAVKAAREALEPCALRMSSVVHSGDPRVRLLQECRIWKADLLVVGSHGRRGMDRLRLGSVSETVAAHAPCSVEVVHSPSALPPRPRRPRQEAAADRRRTGRSRPRG